MMSVSADWYEESLRRFDPQSEYLGTDKPVNRIQPQVSVIVTAYQHGRFIRQCLDSVLMQTTTVPYEIIVGEDESTDETRSICIEYAQAHPDKIRLFLRSRALSTWTGAGRTLMFNGQWCRRSARGTYVAPCEGDDYWMTRDKLQKQVEFLESHPECSMCFGANLDFDDGQEGGDLLFPPGRRPFYTLADILAGNFIGTCASVWRRSNIADLEVWREDMPIGDWTGHILSASKGPMGYIDEVMGARRRHPGGVWSSLSLADKYRGEIRFLGLIRRRIGVEFSRVIDDGIARRYYYLGNEMLAAGRRLPALVSYGRCLKSPGAGAIGRRAVIRAGVSCLLPRAVG
jgi:glycosyltransferase involved in cell wall biosynthesis